MDGEAIMPGVDGHKLPGAERPLRVLICGSGGAGKTALAGWLTGFQPAAGAPQAAAPGKFFTSSGRQVIVTDTPDNMPGLAAAGADAVIVAADAQAGMQAETRRQAYLAGLLGIKHFVLALDMMDLADYSEARYGEMEAAFRDLAARCAFPAAVAIPVSARSGENVTRRSLLVPWYNGPALLEYLEALPAGAHGAAQPFRMPVQAVSREHPNGWRLSGTIVSGQIEPGSRLILPSSGCTAEVKAIIIGGIEVLRASAGDAVTITLAGAHSIAPGGLLAGADEPPEYSDQIAAHIIWMADAPLLPGRAYLLRMNGRTVTASVSALKYKTGMDGNFEKLAASSLARDEIGVCNLALSAPVSFDPYATWRQTGAFTLCGQQSGAAVAAGLVKFGLRRATNIHWQAASIDKAARAALNGQKPVILWFTGLSGSGKSAISNVLEGELFRRGRRTYLLDGDNVRHGLNRDLGFTSADRVENIRRVGEVAKLFVDAGLIVLAAFISPFQAERRMVRELVGPDEYLEIFVDTPIEVCRQRDPKGLYRKADEGKIPNFTGVDSPYEAPETPDLRLFTPGHTPEEMAERILIELMERGIIRG
jgi:bifunctional enzyme CysN/CysC